MINTNKNHLLTILDLVLLYSPFWIAFLIIFNIPDSKHFFSKGVIVSSLYSVFRYFEVLKQEFRLKLKYVAVGLAFCLYFFYMQLINDGNSDLPRSVLYVIIYLLAFPISIARKEIFFVIVSLSAFYIGIESGYEAYSSPEMQRVGYFAINPIPYSFYGGGLSIFCLYFLTRIEVEKFYKVILGVGLILSLTSVLLTQTRGTFLALFIVGFLFSLARLFQIKRTTHRFLFSSVILVLVMLFLNIPVVKHRAMDTIVQYETYEHGSPSSTGIRIELWLSGADILKHSILFGVDKSKVREISTSRVESHTYPDYLGPFLIHPNPNFHNQYIQFLVNSGVIGLLLGLAFILGPVLISGLKSDLTIISLPLSIYLGVCLFFDSLFLYNHTVILYSMMMLLILLLRLFRNGEN